MRASGKQKYCVLLDRFQDILGIDEQKGKMPFRKMPDEVKYAIARISRFSNYTVYEILKPTKAKPKHIPCEAEGIFVLKNS